MGENDLSGKVSLNTTDYKASVIELNRQIRVIESGFLATASAMGQWDKKADGLELRTKALTSQIDLQKQKVSALTAEYQKIVAEKGADSRAAQELEIKLNKQKETLGKMTSELEQTNNALEKMGAESQESGKKVQDLGEKEEETSRKSVDFKGALNGMVTSLKATVVAAAAVATAVIGIAAGIGKMVLSSASAADNLVEMSAKTGISVERLQELSYIGKQTGTALETVTSANAKMIRSMLMAEKGTGDAAAAFRDLGVEIIGSNGELRNSQLVFQEAIAKLGELENPTERDAKAMAIFGKSAQELNPIITTSAEELARMTGEAHAMGAVMSDQAVEGLAGLNDMMDGLKDGLKGVLGEISFAFLPGFQGLAGSLGGYLRQLVEVVKSSNGDLGQMTSGIGSLLGNILADMGENGPEMLNAGLKMLQGVIDSIIGNLPILLPAVVSMLTALVNFIVQNLPLLIDAAVQVLLMLATSLISMLPLLLTAAIQIIVQLANGLTAALPTLIPSVVGIILQLVLTLIENLPMLINAALQLILALAQGLIAALPVLAEQLPTIIIAIVNGLIESVPELLVAAVEIILTLALGIVENIPKLLAVIPQVIDALVQEFKSDEFKVKIKSIGEDLVSGIKNGFNKAWESFKAHFMSSWNELIENVKKLLGISSPSTVFAEIGINMALGLGKGFTNQMAGVRQQIEEALGGFVAEPALTLNNNITRTGNGSESSGSFNGNTYQLMFESYNESEFTRFLRQTERLYGS